ncbi:MAG TPA: hypothetical protein VGP55_06730 [Chitinophagaceae bacterium]|nr:hypothetical protein [Chitinophagaceae bacterium]
MKLIPTLLFVCLLFGCQKKSHSNQVNAVNKAKLYGKWSFVSVLKGSTLTTNATSCYADDWLEFRTDGKGTISQGAFIDNPAILSSQDFAWQYKDEADITFENTELNLLILNDSVLMFKNIFTATGPSSDEWHWKR